MDKAMAQHWFSRAYNAFLQMEQTDKKKGYWQYRIGKLYALGHGIEQDYKQSAEWFAKAMACGLLSWRAILSGTRCRKR